MHGPAKASGLLVPCRPARQTGRFESKDRSASGGRPRHHNREAPYEICKTMTARQIHDHEYTGAISGGRSAMGAHCRARQDGGWAALVFGFNNGRLLPAVVPLAHCQPEECSASRQLSKAPRRPGSGLADGVTRTARRSNAENAAPSREGVPDHRGERRRALAGGLGQTSIGRSPSYFHRVFKATTGADAEGLCRRPPCEEGPSGSGLRQQRHRGDLRRRL